MNERYRILYEPEAVMALEESYDYIREDSSRSRADSWLQNLLDSIDSLEIFPKGYKPWSARRGRWIYSKPVPPVRVFYVVDDQKLAVHVIDVVHMARETRLAPYRSL